MVDIPTDDVSPQSNATEAIPLYIQTSQSQKWDTSQLKAISLVPVTVLKPQGWDCVAVYFHCDPEPNHKHIMETGSSGALWQLWAHKKQNSTLIICEPYCKI